MRVLGREVSKKSVFFSSTLLLSSALIFLVQPLVAKLLLPYLGGSSSVWTACMLFFQSALLVGYGYAHILATRFTTSIQIRIHLTFLVLGVFLLPFTIREPGFDASHYPVAWTLFVLTISVGIPFAILASSAPLLQHWFSKTKGEDSKDPYFLYAASNIGSMGALLSYPFLIEPTIGVLIQTYAWAIGYVLLIIAVLICSRFIEHQERDNASKERSTLTFSRKLKWVVFASIPSSLMLGLTQHITTDLASIPMLWVVPLAIYLLTFIIAFSTSKKKKDKIVPSIGGLFVPIVLFLPSMIEVLGWQLMWVLGLNLIIFGIAAWYFHGELAKDRPDVSELTRFFWLVSLGGVLGGVFNSLITPWIFSRAIDYIFVVGVAIALIHAPPTNKAYPYLLGVLYGGISFFYLWMISFFSFDFGPFFIIAVLLSLFIILISIVRLSWANITLSLALFLGIQVQYRTPGLLEANRSFFGAYKVFDRTHREFPYRAFSHGTTSHGKQSLEEDFRRIPLSYHHPSGPAGEVFSEFPNQKVLVIGLGAGAMAYYNGPEDSMLFYEIDPLVGRIAKQYFGFLEGCQGRCEVKYGDGRMLVEKEVEGSFDIIMLDAYNSDSVPTHLLTREAVALYVKKLRPHGVLLFNASNRYLEIEKVIGAIAKDLNLVARTRIHFPTKAQKKRKIEATIYVLLAKNKEDLRSILHDKKWRESKILEEVWTDDYASIFGALRR